MEQITNWPTPVPQGLHEALLAAGVQWMTRDGVMYVTDVTVAEAALASFDPLAALKPIRKAALAARRYDAEIAGTTLNGLPIPTDRQSQAMVTGAALEATLDADYTVKWKTDAGFVLLDATSIIGLARTIRAHVQACFDREAQLSEAIDAAATVAEVEAIDITVGWP